MLAQKPTPEDETLILKTCGWCLVAILTIITLTSAYSSGTLKGQTQCLQLLQTQSQKAIDSTKEPELGLPWR